MVESEPKYGEAQEGLQVLAYFTDHVDNPSFAWQANVLMLVPGRMQEECTLLVKRVLGVETCSGPANQPPKHRPFEVVNAESNLLPNGAVSFAFLTLPQSLR